MDDREFTAAYREATPYIRGWLIRYGWQGDQADLPDAVHDVFVRFWKGRERYTPHGTAGYFPILHKISRSVAIDHYRKHSARPVSTLIEPDDPAWAWGDPAHDDSRADRDFARAVLLELTPAQRSVLWARHVLGYNIRDIAQWRGVEIDRAYYLMATARRSFIAAAARRRLAEERDSQHHGPKRLSA